MSTALDGARYGMAGAVPVPRMGADYRFGTPQVSSRSLGFGTDAPACDLSGFSLYRGKGIYVFSQSGTNPKSYWQARIDVADAALADLGTNLATLETERDDAQSTYTAAQVVLPDLRTALDDAGATYDAARIEVIKARTNVLWRQRNGTLDDVIAAQSRVYAANTAAADAKSALDDAYDAWHAKEDESTNAYGVWATVAAATDEILKWDLPQAELYLAQLEAAHTAAPVYAGGTPYFFNVVNSYGIFASAAKDILGHSAGTNTEYQWSVKLSADEYRSALAVGVTAVRLHWSVLTSVTLNGPPATTTSSAEAMSEDFDLGDFESLTDENGDRWASGEVHAMGLPALATNSSVTRAISSGFEVPFTSVTVETQGAAMSRPGFAPFVDTSAPGSEVTRYGTATATLGPDAPPEADYAGSMAISLSSEKEWVTTPQFPAGESSLDGSTHAPPADVAATALLRRQDWRPTASFNYNQASGMPTSEQDATLATLDATNADLSQPQGLKWTLSAPITSGVLDAAVNAVTTAAWPDDEPLSVPRPGGHVPFTTEAGEGIYAGSVSVSGAGRIAPVDGTFRARQKLRYKVSYQVPQGFPTPNHLMNFRIRKLTTNLTTGTTADDLLTLTATINPTTGVPGYEGTGGNIRDADWTEIAGSDGQMVQIFGVSNDDDDPTYSSEIYGTAAYAVPVLADAP